MGQLFSRRSPKTTIEILRDIDKEIDDLETNQAEKEYSRRRSIGYLIVFAVLIFFGLLIYAYVHLAPKSGLHLRHYLICLPFVLIYPVLIWFLVWAVCWCYEQSLSAEERKLTRLHRRKRDILDTVKDKETYKVAKEILERFDPLVRQEKTAKKARELQQQLAAIRRYASLDGDGLTNASSPGSQLRNRRNRKSRSPSPSLHTKRKYSSEHPALPGPTSETDAASSFHPPTPLPAPLPTLAVNIIPPTLQRPTIMKPMGPVVGGATFRTPMLSASQRGHAAPGSSPEITPMMIQTPLRLPRPIIPQNRSIFDKIIDYLLEEGPSCRYALICQRCHSHNGMALKEELETMAFRCCYCFAFNPARKLAQPPSASDKSTDQKPMDNAAPTHTPSRPSTPAAEPEPPHQQGASGFRAPSRSSVGSLDSIQSLPPFFRPMAQSEADQSLLQGEDEDRLPTCAATMTSNDSVASIAAKQGSDAGLCNFDDTEIAGRVDEVDESNGVQEALDGKDPEYASGPAVDAPSVLLNEAIQRSSAQNADVEDNDDDFEELALDALEHVDGSDSADVDEDSEDEDGTAVSDKC